MSTLTLTRPARDLTRPRYEAPIPTQPGPSRRRPPMERPPARRSWRTAAAVVLVLVLVVALAGLGLLVPDRAPSGRADGLADVDLRDTLSADHAPTATQRAAADALSGATVRWDERYGTARLVIHHGGYLSGPDTDPRRFLAGMADLLGLSPAEVAELDPVQDYRTDHNGSRTLFYRQTDGGRPVYGAIVKLSLDREGRVVIVSGSHVPGATIDHDPVIEPQQALRRALGVVGRWQPQVIATEDGPTRRTAFADALVEQSSAPPFAVREPTAALVTFPMPGGRPARLAWRVQFQRDGRWREVLVDARSGEDLLRRGFRAEAGPEGDVFEGQNAVIGTFGTVSFAGAPFDDAGWVADRTTTGNNADVYQDVDDDDAADYRPLTPPAGDPGHQHFSYPFTDAFRTSGGTDYTTDRDASITQAFYRINQLHDYFYALGFDEAAGNFQTDNFGRGGVGGDAMLVEVQNGAAITDPDVVKDLQSNTQTPPGAPPRMELIVYPAAGLDGALDGDLTTHEYVHGVSNRLVVGESTGGGIPQGVQSWALGEGWSDFYGTSVWDDPVAGELVCPNPTGCPQYAYDDTPLVYSDICTRSSTETGCEPHADGEIWTAALWDLRTTMQARYGVAAGKARTEQLVVDGMKDTPAATPSFLDGRDALLSADMKNTGGLDQCAIWVAFARREMGVNATTSANQQTVGSDTTLPPECVPTADAGGPYVTVEGAAIILDGTGSATASDPSSGPIVGYEWDLDGDGDHDDAAGPVPTFDGVGQDGTTTIELKITDSAGAIALAQTTVTVSNVAPTVAIDPPTTVVEGGTVTLAGSVTDPGWLDPLTATVDWGDGQGPQALSGSVENAPPDAVLTFSAARTYGDDGTFPIEVCGSDDDVTTCETVSTIVDNVNPVVAVDTSGQVTYGGVAVFLGSTGEPIEVPVTVTDPGSDDETITWDWGDGTTSTVVSLVAPPDPDPTASPSVDPRFIEVARTHGYGSACLNRVVVDVVDDDGGTVSDGVDVVVVGQASRVRGSGWWLAQIRPSGPKRYGDVELQCLLDIATHLSTVLSGPLDRATAADLLRVNGANGAAAELFDEHLLAAWLNFAAGGIGLDTPVDTDGNGQPDTTFGESMLTAETVRLDPTASRADVLAQRDILERIIERDG